MTLETGTADRAVEYSSGSGTVLDAERGVILTNYHVMGDTDKGELYNPDGLAYIAVNPPDLRTAPVMLGIAVGATLAVAP